MENEYQKALKALESIALNYDAEYVNECNDDYCEYMKKNIELIRNCIIKAKPTNPSIVEGREDEPCCPYCQNPLDGSEEHCEVCDQRIDWNSN